MGTTIFCVIPVISFEIIYKLSTPEINDIITSFHCLRGLQERGSNS